MKEIEITATGRVQMVMYRDFALRKARKLGVVGFVENQEDGSVLIVAQGENKAIKEYCEFLESGSKFSRVDNIKVKENKKLGKYTMFNIIF